MEDGKRWITWRGRRILVNANGNIVKNGYSLYREFTKAKRLDTKEYDKLRNDFEKTLTNKEKERIYHYGVGGGASYSLNNRNWDNWKMSYRFVDNTNKRGYHEEKLNDLQAISRQLDKKATYIKTKNDRDDVIKSNYDRMKHLQQDIKEMDKIFKEKGVSLDKDIIVYRKGYESLEDLQNGVVRYGYTSTSAMPRINKQTPGGMILGNNEFEIIIPKGMKFLPIENLVDDDIKKQHEILLPRNIKFKLITDKSKEAKFDITKKNLWTRGETRYFVRAEEVKK